MGISLKFWQSKMVYELRNRTIWKYESISCSPYVINVDVMQKKSCVDIP